MDHIDPSKTLPRARVRARAVRRLRRHLRPIWPELKQISGHDPRAAMVGERSAVFLNAGAWR